MRNGFTYPLMFAKRRTLDTERWVQKVILSHQAMDFSILFVTDHEPSLVQYWALVLLPGRCVLEEDVELNVPTWQCVQYGLHIHDGLAYILFCVLMSKGYCIWCPYDRCTVLGVQSH